MNKRDCTLACIALLCSAQVVQGAWDYIVVGAGASGCIIAPQLALGGKSVLLLEAGGRTAWDFGGRDQSAAFGRLESSTIFDVPGENERLRRNRGNFWSNVPWGLNGLGIGGSGMINGALTFIPSPDDFRSWPWPWKYEQMTSAFQETFSKLSVTSTPSADGVSYVQGAADAFEAMATQQMGMRKVNLNENPHDRVNTFSASEVTAKDGRRVDACLAFLLPALDAMDNLRLEPNAEVRRITFEPKGKARGVILQSNGTEVFLNPGGKLVLTAGTLQTPRLLMVSGVGPRSELDRLQPHGLVLNGENYWIENEQVGKNMHDHSFSSMVIKVPNVPDFSFRYYNYQNDPTAGSMYLKDRTGPYAQYGPVRVGFIAMPGRSSPDVELLVMTSGVEGGSQGRDCNTCFRILLMNMDPKAREPVQLKTPGMYCDCGGETCKVGDICKPRLYMTNRDDIATIQWAYEEVIKAAKAQGYEVIMPPQTDSAGIADFIQNSHQSKFSASHWAGSCQLGTCTDMTLKVKGTENIYIGDSSLFPAPVRAHNVGTVFAVAYRAAEIISSLGSS